MNKKLRPQLEKLSADFAKKNGGYRSSIFTVRSCGKTRKLSVALGFQGVIGMDVELFKNEYFHVFADRRRDEMRKEIAKIADEDILTCDEDNLAKQLFTKYKLESITLGQETINPTEREVDIRRHSNVIYHNFPTTEKRPVIILTIHYAGDGHLMKFRPATSNSFHPPAQLLQDRIIVDLIMYDESQGYAKRQIEEFKKQLGFQVINLNDQIKAFTNSLIGICKQELINRKLKVSQRLKVAESLGIPIVRNQNVSKFLNVPEKQIEIKLVKVKALNPSNDPEYHISQEIYKDILQLIHEWGTVMEQHPDTYEGKGEDALRNLFLLFLASHFRKQSVTGETFNKGGKTDILIKEGSQNVFVAECKIWKGDSAFHKAIDQLLRYLTWQDSKACLIMFVPNQDITSIDDRIVELTKTHPRFQSFVEKKANGFYRFVFQISEENKKEVQFAVMLFHFTPCKDLSLEKAEEQKD